jgi:hypothetical protein
MAAETKSRRRRLILLIIIGAAVPLAALAIPQARPSRWLLEHWRRNLPSTNSAELPIRLRQVAVFDEAGLPLLVDVLASEDESHASIAGEVLAEQMDRWELLRSEHSSPKVAELVRLLARNRPATSPNAQQTVHDLAMRCLRWPLDRTAVDAQQVIADCETVLTAAHSRSMRGLDDEAGSEPAVDAVVHQRPAPLPPPQSFALRDSRPVAVDPRIVTPSLDNGPLGSEASSNRQGMQVPTTREAATRPPDTDHRRTNPIDDSAVAPSPYDVPRHPRVPAVAANSASQFGAWTTPLVEGPLSNLPDIEVIRRLDSSTPELPNAVTDELRRRGYTELDLRIAERLVDPDARIRLQLVQWLPQAPGIDAGRWLLWLARDDEPQVRKAAITVLATASDPSLRRQLERIAQEEQDPAVLQTVRSFLESNRFD